jgi:hypothetical protein
MVPDHDELAKDAKKILSYGLFLGFNPEKILTQGSLCVLCGLRVALFLAIARKYSCPREVPSKKNLTLSTHLQKP